MLLPGIWNLRYIYRDTPPPAWKIKVYVNTWLFPLSGMILLTIAFKAQPSCRNGLLSNVHD